MTWLSSPVTQWIAIGFWFVGVAALVGFISYVVGSVQAAARCLEITDTYGRGAATVIREEFGLWEYGEREENAQ